MYCLPWEDSLGSLGETEFTLQGLGVSSDYALEEVEGVPYIVESGEGIPGRVLTREDLQTYGPVLSLLETIEEPPSWEWDSLPEIVPFAKIKLWLKKYGLPAFDGGFLNSRNRYAFPLPLFQKHAATMFLLFKVWESAYYERESDMLHYWKALVRHPDFVPCSKKEYKENETAFREKPLANKKDSALWLAGMVIDHEIKTTVELRFSGASKKFYAASSSLFAICYHQMGVLLSRGDHVLGKNIKTCANPACQKVFWGHGNARWCPACDRRTMWSRGQSKSKRKGD